MISYKPSEVTVILNPIENEKPSEVSLSYKPSEITVILEPTGEVPKEKINNVHEIDEERRLKESHSKIKETERIPDSQLKAKTVKIGKNSLTLKYKNSGILRI